MRRSERKAKAATHRGFAAYANLPAEMVPVRTFQEIGHELGMSGRGAQMIYDGAVEKLKAKRAQLLSLLR